MFVLKKYEKGTVFRVILFNFFVAMTVYLKKKKQ